MTQQVLVLLTCLVAAASYAGAVTNSALGAFVLPGVVIGAVVGGVWAVRGRRLLAVGMGVLIALGWAEAVNALSGTGDGPAARSTFLAGALAVLAVVAANSSWPATFLAPVGGIVAGALALGAGGEVRIVAVATAVVAVVALASVEKAHRQWVRRPRRRWSVGLLCLLVGGAALLAVWLQADHDTRPPARGLTSSIQPSIRPGWTDPLPKPARHHHRAHHASVTKHRPSSRTTARAVVKQKKVHSRHVLEWVVRVLLGIAALLLLLLLVIAARLAYVRRAWRRTYRRLHTGTPQDSVVGAWLWARLWLRVCAMPLSLSVSPDVAAQGEGLDDLPDSVAAPLRSLASVATTGAFAPAGVIVDADAAWSCANETDMAAWDALSRRGRTRVRFTSPPPMQSVRGSGRTLVGSSSS